ncbi:unnamed protein product, partial [Prorocentrum cordatum]
MLRGQLRLRGGRPALQLHHSPVGRPPVRGAVPDVVHLSAGGAAVPQLAPAG